jgi:hypothetical protein
VLQRRARQRDVEKARASSIWLLVAGTDGDLCLLVVRSQSKYDPSAAGTLEDHGSAGDQPKKEVRGASDVAEAEPAGLRFDRRCGELNGL